MSSSVNLTGMQALSTMSGSINYSSIIQQLDQVNRAPGDALNTTIQNEQLKENDWANISNLAAKVQNDLLSFDQNSSVYSTFKTSVTGTNSSGITATASTGAFPGTYNIDVTALGSTASSTSSAQIGSPLTSSNASTITISSNDFSQAITTGTVSMTIGSTTYTHNVTSSDTIDTIMNDFQTQSGNAFTYDVGTTAADKLSVKNNSASTIYFGSSGDASNFFQVAGLTSLPAAAGATSTGSLLGVVQINQPLQNANFSTAPYTGSMPGSTGQDGDLKINGVDITYNTASDNLQAVLNRINASTAGVTASYDPLNDKVDLTSNTSQPISVQDVSGQLGKALNILGTGSAGSQWSYTINGNTQTSSSATVTTAIPGVSFTMSQTGSATVTVSSDSSTLTTAVNNFVNDFNTLSNQLRSYTGKGGDLEGDNTAASAVYQYMNDVLDNLSGVNYPQTSVMGIGISNGAIGSTPGTTNNLQVDTNALTTAFQDNPAEVQTLLYNMAQRLNGDLTDMTGQFNDLTPINSSTQNIVGTAQSEQNMYAGMITSTEDQQQQIYNIADQQEQQMVQQYTQLQQYQQQMATQQSAISAMISSLG